MAEFPMLPLSTDAYIADTQHLSLEEHGAYLKLLMIAWRSPDCALPDDDKRLATMLGITPKKWSTLKGVVMAFWSLRNGHWRQKRLTKERRRVAELRAKKRDAAERRWEGKSLEDNETDDAAANAGGDAGAYATRPRTISKKDREENTQTEGGSPKANNDNQLEASFDDWWQRYPRYRRGARGPTRKKWLGLVRRGAATADDLHAGLDRYLAAGYGDSKYAVGAERFLNGEFWTIEQHPPPGDQETKGNGNERSNTTKPDPAAGGQKRLRALARIAGGEAVGRSDADRAD